MKLVRVGCVIVGACEVVLWLGFLIATFDYYSGPVKPPFLGKVFAGTELFLILISALAYIIFGLFSFFSPKFLLFGYAASISGIVGRAFQFLNLTIAAVLNLYFLTVEGLLPSLLSVLFFNVLPLGFDVIILRRLRARQI